MKVIACLVLAAISISSAAQHSKDDNRKHGDMPLITRSLGGSFQKFNGLNGRVAGLAQYEQLKNYAATLGLGWLKERNRVISNAGVMIGSSMSGHRDEKSSTIRYLGFNADIGYDVLKSDMIVLYPFAGLGLQAYQAVFYKDNSVVDFDDVLGSSAVQNSITPVKFKNRFVVYRAGFGISFKSPKDPSNSIGIQAGYTGSFKKNDWRTNDGQSLANSPEDRISQVFVSLILTSKPGFMMK